MTLGPNAKVQGVKDAGDRVEVTYQPEGKDAATVSAELARIVHTYRRGVSVELRFFLVEEFQGEIDNRIFREVRWVRRAELPSFDFLEADRGLVKDIAEGKVLP